MRLWLKLALRMDQSVHGGAPYEQVGLLNVDAALALGAVLGP